ncbi:host nuclease inhibitor [Arthrobacter phage Edmundo]|nr:host nuclease inhibitor [Arthrobacter phage Edmundo]
MTPPADKPQLPGQISLDEYLNADFDAQMEGEAEVTISGDPDAALAMRKLASLHKQKAANDSIAESEVNRVAAWLADVQRPIQNKIAFLEDKLAGFALHERTAHDRKTISLPHGKIATRPIQDEWTVEDRDAFIKWAKESGIADLVKVKEDPALTVIKNALQGNDDGTVITVEGEPVPGVKYTPGKGFKATVTPAK